jgi:hypothetical protein
MTTDLLTRITADRQRIEKEREANRKRHPFAMELFDGFREAGLEPRLKHAVNAAGEELGSPPKVSGFVVDGDKLAHLCSNDPTVVTYESSWRRFYGKKAETNATYRERMQRAIKPGMGIE